MTFGPYLCDPLRSQSRFNSICERLRRTGPPNDNRLARSRYRRKMKATRSKPTRTAKSIRTSCPIQLPITPSSLIACRAQPQSVHGRTCYVRQVRSPRDTTGAEVRRKSLRQEIRVTSPPHGSAQFLAFYGRKSAIQGEPARSDGWPKMHSSYRMQSRCLRTPQGHILESWISIIPPRIYFRRMTLGSITHGREPKRVLGDRSTEYSLKTDIVQTLAMTAYGSPTRLWQRTTIAGCCRGHEPGLAKLKAPCRSGRNLHQAGWPPNTVVHQLRATAVQSPAQSEPLERAISAHKQ